jgi:hypothetical protein
LKSSLPDGVNPKESTKGVNVAKNTDSKKKSQANRCSIAVRNLPLERFRLPRDGRKWRQLARVRSAVLLYLSTFASGDGSFTLDEKNFSPSLKRLLTKYARATLFRRLDDLWDLALLSWSRPSRSGRRIYAIDPSAEFPSEEQIRKLRETRRSHIRPSEVSYSQEKHVSYSNVGGLTSEPKGGLTSEPVPSLEEPSYSLGLFGCGVGVEKKPLNLSFIEPTPFFSNTHTAPQPRRKSLDLLWTQAEYLEFYASVQSVADINPEYRILDLAPIVLALLRENRSSAIPGLMLPDANAICEALDKALADAKANAPDPNAFWDDLGTVA